MAMTLDDIAQQLEGYDPQALSVPLAQQFILRLVQGLPRGTAETIPVDQAFDRILSADVTSPISVPGHDNAAMDGFAFRSTDCSDQATQSMASVGHALAGQPWSGVVGPGQCIRITTGAVMPAGLDTVVPHELTQSANGVVTWPTRLTQPGDNRRLAGEDIAKGALALARGTRLGPAELGLLASLGIPTASVQKRLRVAYFSTGDEILSLGDRKSVV